MIDQGLVSFPPDIIDLDLVNPCTDILNNVILSIMVPQGSFFQNTKFGSKLYMLKRTVASQDLPNLASDYIHEALQWLVDAGRIKSQQDITVQAALQTLSGTTRLVYRVDVTQADGQQVSFSNFVMVN